MLHIPASRLAICLKSMAIAPVIILTAAIWIVPNAADTLTKALISYAALWLAAVGGVHWGLALHGTDKPTNIYRYLYAFMPILFGLSVLMADARAALFLLFLGFLMALHVDRKTLSGWYVTVRAITTALWCACLYAAYYAL